MNEEKIAIIKKKKGSEITSVPFPWIPFRTLLTKIPIYEKNLLCKSTAFYEISISKDVNCF